MNRLGLRFILGRSGCGKTERMFKEIKNHLKTDEKTPIIILVPDQFTYEMEKRVSSLFDGDIKDKYLRVRPMGMGSLSDMILSESGGLSKVGINSSGKAMIVYRAIEKNADKMRIFKDAYKQIGFVQSISDVISEMKQFKIDSQKLMNISEDVKNENLSMKLKDIADIYSTFEDDMSTKYVDIHDRVSSMTKNIKNSSFISGSYVYIDGFTSFTPNQYDLLGEIIKYSKETTVILTLDYPNKSGIEDMFSGSRNTYRKLKSLCEKEGFSYEPKNCINMYNEKIHRFRGNKELEHLEKNYSTYPYRMYIDETESIKIKEYRDMYQEIEKTASQIASDIRDGKYRYRDITVATRNLERYESLIKSIFSEYEIPFFINKKGDAMENPIIIMILSVLEMKRRRYGYETMFRYIKSNMTGLGHDEISELENYVIANGISGSKWFEENWNYRTGNYAFDIEESEEEIEKRNRINEIKEKVIKPIRDFDRKLSEKSRNRVSDICRYLYEFLCDIDIFGQINISIEEFRREGKLEEAARYAQVWNTVSDMLDQLVEILGDEFISLERFSRIVNLAFSEYSLKTVPPGADEVMVTGIDRMKSSDTACIYLIGTNDGVFPATAVERGLISDSDRGYITDIGVEVDKDSRAQIYDEQFLVYKALTSTSKELIVSYPVSDYEGKTMRPSIIVSRIKRIYPNVNLKSYIQENQEDMYGRENIVSPKPLFNSFVEGIRMFSEGYMKENEKDIFFDLYRYYSENQEYRNVTENSIDALDFTNQEENIDKEMTDKLYPEKTVSVSRIEKYAGCPFAYFVEYGLKASERKEYEFTAPDVGSFVHRVIEIFSKNMKRDSITWHEVDELYISIRASKIVDEMVAKIPGYILESSPKYRFLSERLKKLVSASIKIIAMQIKAGNFESEDYEAAFGRERKYPPIKVGTDRGETLELIGKIDRIDSCVDEDNRKYIRIVDYKWGDRDINLNEVYHGLQLQLIVYMNAILEGQKYSNDKVLISPDPAGMLYSRLNNPIIKTEEPISDDELEKKIFESFKMKGLLISDPKILINMDRNLLINGKSSVIRAEIKKDGTVSQRTSGVTKEQFDILRQYTKKRVSELCSGMMSGNIRIEPVKSGERNSCEFCPYSAICQFDTSIKDNKYTVIKNLTPDEVIFRMKGELE